MAGQDKASFLELPPEIREQIYAEILHPDNNRLFRPDEYTHYDYRAALVLYRLNQQIYLEARKIFRELNSFVRIETPWSEAQDHVAVEGHVPIMMKGARAERFMGHSLRVQIEAPIVASPGEHMQYFVILVDDLPAFTKVWFYSNLSNPGGLNHFLSLQLALRDPYAPEWEEKRVPRRLQRRLLLPFGMVKDLRHFSITGNPKPLSSIVSEVKAEQAVPPPSPERALAEATRLKTEGNAALNAGQYRDALQLYKRAWEAMHIIVKGRQRHIHAEAFFARELEEEPFKGKNGQVERLGLRTQLVANTCYIYLKLEDWEEVVFWGMRTIGLVRQATGANEYEIPPENEALTGFPSATSVGKIYHRTAVAYKELGDKDQARRLLRVAHEYLPHDRTVQKELAACALRLG
ncbi:hypothetical protein GGR56DRAFT_227530 [Xylariaceae sp. FL0804]|nr:hypothetical protein GGR56DRAFT_227530 [Xylariaceae sp. FL0804]